MGVDGEVIDNGRAGVLGKMKAESFEIQTV